jgi:hypothetical protein
MVDIFIRTTRNNQVDHLRRAFFMATVARWEIEPDAVVHIIHDREIRDGRVYAEKAATSDPYIVTDDDVVIHGKDWLRRGREVLLANPDYAIASTLSLIESENAAVGEGPIYPMHWVGAPMWIRKGILTDLPEMDLGGECRVIHEYVAAKGFKEGLIAGIRHMHLGYGFSSNPNLHWGY